ncbi:hypothetical protein MHY29_09775 [Micrococcus sp. ACRRV]|uniref:hypothetical protein n=1 Tax=Micrococcus sp. ACRRV TaxID=2918203 RepID=UPI001EF2E0BB|nr:hypothetical protein [Micrococcus sp. ACRRV]MCG7423100.1 hypothetical protein [Micrococcus sp. ACRRV]
MSWSPMTPDRNTDTVPALDRRRVVQGLAWTAPAVAVATAAPAFATSPRCFKTVDVVWSDMGYKRTSATSATYTTADPDGTGPMRPLTLTVENTYKGSNIQFGNQFGTENTNLAVQSGSVGGYRNPLVLHQSPLSNKAKSNDRIDANKTITTFTFDRPVTSLTFSITDIDSAVNDFVDGVAVSSPTPFTTSKANATTAGLQGAGTLADPWRPNRFDNSISNSSTNGNGTVSFTSQVTSFEIHYWNQTAASYASVDGDQKIFISNLSLTYNACA